MNVFTTAKQIRKKGEPWQNAIQRASKLQHQIGGSLQKQEIEFQRKKHRQLQKEQVQYLQNQQYHGGEYWIEEDEVQDDYQEMFS